MKNNRFLLAFALCIGLQFNTSIYSSESYLSQALKAASSTVSSYWQSIQNTVSNWSTRKKIAVTSALLASLAAIYNREALMTLVDDAQIKAQEAAVYREALMPFVDNAQIKAQERSRKLREQRRSIQEKINRNKPGRRVNIDREEDF